MTAFPVISPDLSEYPLPAAGDDQDHLWCCDRDISMCGLDISGEQETELGDDDPVCPLCALVEDEGLPCPVPGCPGYEP